MQWLQAGKFVTVRVRAVDALRSHQAMLSARDIGQPTSSSTHLQDSKDPVPCLPHSRPNNVGHVDGGIPAGTKRFRDIPSPGATMQSPSDTNGYGRYFTAKTPLELPARLAGHFGQSTAQTSQSCRSKLDFPLFDSLKVGCGMPVLCVDRLRSN